MQSIIYYLKYMSKFMLLIIPIFLIIRYIKYMKSKEINLKNELLLFIFIIYLTGLMSVTILPKISIINGEFIINNVGYKYLNLIPFKIFYDTIIEIKKDNIDYLIISFIGNIVMFIPIGILLPLIYKIDYKKTIIIGFSISLFIEIMQFIFLERETDIDDLILNTLGVMIGLIMLKYIILFKNRR